jgi:integrase
VPARRVSKPRLTMHRPSGQARVRIDGKDHYLGRWRSPESVERFDTLVNDWLLSQSPDRFRLLVGELTLRFMEHAQAYYVKGGRPTSEVHTYRAALGFVNRRFKTDRAADFSPLKLKAAREDMIAAGLSRQTIIKYQARIIAVWKWAVSEELVKADVWQSLRAVPGLRAGRSAAPEAPPVLPVAEEIVNATLPHLPPVVASMVRLQMLTGMRPAEVAMLTPGEIDRTEAVWQYVPKDHKTQHRGKERRIFIGPQGQAILAPYINGRPDTPVFRVSPRPEASAYPTAAYRRAITRGCELAFGMPEELRDVPKNTPEPERSKLRAEAAKWRAAHCWSPNQLRHTFATDVRRRFGLEAAQVLLGHSEADTTQIYAERDAEKAVAVMLAVG